LLDEPTSALDPQLTNEVLEMVLELQQSGTNLILVTHEMSFASAQQNTCFTSVMAKLLNMVQQMKSS
jgi:polar amino acid transport system ATP-binding protein